MEENRQIIPATFVARSEQLEQQEPPAPPDEAERIRETLRVPECAPGDVESFLLNNSVLFGLIERGWGDVQRTTGALKAIVMEGYYPVEDPFNDRYIIKKIGEHTPRQIRKFAEQTNIELFQELAQGARDKIDDNAIAETAQYITQREQGRDQLEALAGLSLEMWHDQKAERQEKRAGKSSHSNDEITEVLLPDEIINGAQDLLYCYTFAFGIQHAAIQRITAMLQEDANVMPFVERLQEIAELRYGGINEFPGLLETVSVLILQQQNTDGISCIEQAIMRVGGTEQTIADFTKRVFAEEAPHIGGQPSKEFLASIVGAKMVAESVTAAFGDQDISQDKIIEALSGHLENVTNGKEWIKAYEADTTARSRTVWRNTYQAVRRYERRGRLPGSRSPSRSEKTQQPTGKRRKHRTASVSLPDTQDIVSPQQEHQTLPELAVMKSLKGADTRFAVDRVEDIDHLMDHDVITRFIRRHANTSAIEHTLEQYLRFLWENPLDPRTTRALEQRFHVQDPTMTHNNRYRLRRFRAHSQFDEVESDPLNSRIRLLYGIVPTLQKGRLLLLHTVTLRDGTTY